MKTHIIAALIFASSTLTSLSARAQTGSPSVEQDSLALKPSPTSAIVLKGYAEGYISVDGNKPAGMNRPLLYNFSRDREFSLNLAFVEISHQHGDLRFKFTPAFGGYMQANYAAEPEGFRYIFEANAGVRLSAKHNLWLDAGVLPSPYGYEGAVNLLQNNLSRSLSAENSPYYITGARLSAPLGTKVQLNVFAINGWQNIRETNRAKSFAAQIQYQATSTLLLNYSAYLGDERATLDSTKGKAYRSFHDFYAKYSPSDRLNLVALFDFGTQNGYSASTKLWHTANITARIKLMQKLSLSLRAEYYSDPKQAIVALPMQDASLYGASVGLNYGITDQVLLRVESRLLNSDKRVFVSNTGKPSDSYLFNTASLAVYF